MGLWSPKWGLNLGFIHDMPAKLATAGKREVRWVVLQQRPKQIPQCSVTFANLTMTVSTSFFLPNDYPTLPCPCQCDKSFTAVPINHPAGGVTPAVTQKTITGSFYGKQTGTV